MPMRIFRKRSKFGNFRGAAEDTEPLPDIVYQMGAEQAARYAALLSRTQSPYAANNLRRQEGAYSIPHVSGSRQEGDAFHEIYGPESGEKVPSSSPLNVIASALGMDRIRRRNRTSRSTMNNFVRTGSPGGSPLHFGSRSNSPEMIQSRSSSPYQFSPIEPVPSPLHFAQSERMPSPLNFTQQPSLASPDVARRMERARLSQELQQLEKQQRLQQSMMNYTAMFAPQYPQGQQPFYPMMNTYGNNQAYSMMQQPQMYPHF